MSNPYDAIRYTLVDANGNPSATSINPHDSERIQLVDADGNTIAPDDILNDALAASVAATYVALAQIPIALDTDGVPYFANGSNFTGAVPIKTDTDGVPYLAA